MRLGYYLSAIVLLGIVAAACSGSGTAPPGPTLVSGAGGSAFRGSSRHHHKRIAGTIDKVFVIVQENRTIDNIFNDFPGADTQNYGYWGTTKITLTAGPMATPFDLPHSLAAFNTDTGCPPVPNIGLPWFCPMNMFQTPSPSGGPNAYAYVEQKYTKPYWAMAQQYVLGDKMFQSNLDGSYVSHQYLIAGQANSTTDFPTPKPCNGASTPNARWVTQDRQYGSDPKYITACQSYSTTVVSQLKKKSIGWRYYTAKPGVSGFAYWDPFFWIISGYGYYGYYNSIIKNPCRFLTDIASPSGYAPSITWITPSGADSDHAVVTQNYFGPDWVTSVVNAIGKSQYWNESVIFITWDDWGGWYDHDIPPYKDYDGLGIRVPFIIISPFSRSAYVTHTHYEQASILRYIEDLFGLKQMSAADTRANDPANDDIWITGTPRPFATISPYPNGDSCGSQGSPDDD